MKSYILMLWLLGSLILSACTLNQTPPSPTTTPIASVPTAQPQPTLAPASAIPRPSAAPATAVPASPTLQPTLTATALPSAVPATAVPPSATTQPIPTEPDTPGPEWKFLLESDANQDGVSDTVYYIPSNAIPGTSFNDPRRDAVAVVASDIVIVQNTGAGLQTLMQIDQQGGSSDVPLFNFDGQRTPAAYLLALDPAQGPFMNLLPFGAGGVGYEQIGVHWEAGANGFRIVGEQPGSATLREAHAALSSFLTALHNKQYSAAVTNYSGSYGAIQSLNPDVEQNDYTTLFQHACEINGFACLEPLSIEPLSTDGYMSGFNVTFRAADGSVFFIQQPGSEKISLFPMSVLKQDDGSRVVTLPPYVP